MTTNRLPAASRKRHDNSTITLKSKRVARQPVDIDAKFCSLTDSKGKQMKIHRATGFNGIGYGGFTIGHILVDGPVSSLTKYRLELKAKNDSIVSASFVAQGLQFTKHTKKPTKAEQQRSQAATR